MAYGPRQYTFCDALTAPLAVPDNWCAAGFHVSQLPRPAQTIEAACIHLGSAHRRNVRRMGGSMASFKSRQLVGAAVAGALLASSAWAQTAPSTDVAKTDNGLEEVIVTAQFHQENLQTTPLAITAITGDMLAARSETTLQDVASQAPNVILQQNPAGG